MKLIKEKSTQVCPRCGMKSLIGMESCPDCGLVFSRLQLATNKDAKRKMRRKDKDFIIYTNKLPSDVSYIKLFLFTIFLGIAGGYCFYVGRYWRGGILLANTVMLLLCVIFNSVLINVDDGNFIAAIATLGGLLMLIWVYDIVIVTIKKFKVPVAIDLESSGVTEEVKE